MLRTNPLHSEAVSSVCGCGRLLQGKQPGLRQVQTSSAVRQAQQDRARTARPTQAVPETAEAREASVASTSGRPPQIAAPKSQVWEIDFFSRPIYDERGKKRWELLICDQERTWEFIQSFPNNKITSAAVSSAPQVTALFCSKALSLALTGCCVQLKIVLEKVLALPGAEKPLVALFFRRQMVTIISRALRELDIVPLSSQRCFALLGARSAIASYWRCSSSMWGHCSNMLRAHPTVL